MMTAARFSWPREGLVLGGFAALVLAMPLWLPWIGGYEALATKIVIWAIFALGFDILLGFTAYLSFGHAAFFGTSAYITGLMLKHASTSIIWALFASAVGTLVLAFILGGLILRRSGIYFSILSLAFAQMLHAAALSIFARWTGGDNGLTMDTAPELLGMHMEGQPMFYFAALLLIAGFVAARQIKRSPLGLMLQAVKENHMRLEYTGVNVMGYKIAAYVISAVYAGVAGSLMVIYEPYVATKFLNWSTSGEVVIMSVIGGVNTLVGPMLGAGFMLYFENVVQGLIGAQWKLVLGLIFVLVVIFLPGGFVDLWRRLRRRFGPAPDRRDNVPDAPGSLLEQREARYKAIEEEA
ncbi:branched-chain amino acid ABC transporter permease [Desulfohalovibrio reitneri]|uniref:branched-chain amino acid ABC transporter permease n=1 Tax=Desulfohalovibrio reitneri TaxID=1307759 RepID=UPI00069245CB|nr:branched-chain amino acid ABC transporter permease [Desulfohalovibrio reitneri]